MTILSCPFIIIISLTLVCSTLAQGQQSIIAQMMSAQDSLVTIQAENIDLYSGQPAIAAFDRKSGRVLVSRKVAQASYNRTGAGVIVHRTGIIVTNAHIILNANTIKVRLADNRVFPAQILRVMNPLDLAFLGISAPESLKALPMADSNQIKLGDEVISIGNSPLLDQTVSGGKIIGIGSRRSHLGLPGQGTELIQTSITLYSGDSGGPLFDRQGQLLGLMTAKETSSDHSSFAIPANKIAEQLIDYLNKKSKIP